MAHRGLERKETVLSQVTFKCIRKIVFLGIATRVKFCNDIENLELNTDIGPEEIILALFGAELYTISAPRTESKRL